MRCFTLGVIFAVATLVAGGRSWAQTYKTITINDEYSDWAGVPVLNSDAGDNSGGPDIGNTQIANDSQYLYIRNTYANGLTLQTYIGIDVDENAATGWDVFGLGLLGSDAGWVNQIGVAQAAGVFNSGPLTGDFSPGGYALLAPLVDSPSRELAISLTSLRTGGLPIFPDNTIRLVIYTDSGQGADGLPAGFPGDSGINGDMTAVINYTLAVPEPGGVAALFATLGACVARRRRR